MMTSWLLSAGFIVLWIVCFLHCLKNDKLYRFFGLPSILVQVLWFLFFLTFSPFALLAYLILGIMVKQKKKRTVLAHAFYTLLFLLGFLVSIPSFLFQTIEPSGEGPARIARTPSGWQESQGTPEKAQFDWKRFIPTFHFGINKSQVNTQSISTIMAGSHTGLSTQRIAIVLDSDHPLLQETANFLVENLKEYPEVKSIEILPGRQLPRNGALLPDVWIHLGMPQITEWQIPPQLRLNAVIDLSVSDSPFHCSHGYSETPSSPTLNYNLGCELSHDSTTVSIGSANAKYAMAVPEIGKELVNTARDFFDKTRAQHGDVPAEIDRFSPKQTDEFQPPLESLKRFEPVIRGYLPLLQSIAYWEIPIEGDLKTDMDRMAEELKQAGWNEQNHSGENETPYFRYAKDNDRLTAFLPQHLETVTTPLPPPKTYIIKYERRMNPDQIKPQLMQMASENASVEFLMAMNDWFWSDDELRTVYRQALEKLHDVRPEILVQKATLYGSIQEYEKQWRALQEARAAELWMRSESTPQSAIDDEIKKFKNKHADLFVEIPWPELFREFGAQEMKAGEETVIEKTVKLNEPVGCYRLDEAGKPYTACAVMLKNTEKNNPAPYVLRVRSQSGGGGSSTTTGGTPSPGRPGRFQWNSSLNDNHSTYAATSKTGEENQFTVRFTVRPMN